MGLKDIFHRGFKPKTDKRPPVGLDYPSGGMVLDERRHDEVIHGYPFVLLEFFAVWCAPCNKMRPKMKWLAKEMKGKVLVATVDVGSQKRLAGRYGVKGVPRFILLHFGEEVESFQGVQDVTRLSRKLDSYHRAYVETVEGHG